MQIPQQRNQLALRHDIGREHGQGPRAGDLPGQTAHGFLANMQTTPVQELVAHLAAGVVVTRVEKNQIPGLGQIFPVVAENPAAAAVYAADDIMLMKMIGKILQQPVKQTGLDLQIRVKTDHTRPARHGQLLV